MNSRENARRWLPAVLIFLAALVAQGGCLGSTFYLDDWTQIVENDGVDAGLWWQNHLRALTYLTYWLTYRCFGMSSPAFHAGNLLLHAGVALAVFGFAREFLAEAAGLAAARARRIGAWAGGLFAVHPLCSEIPNYARGRDIELVSLFMVLTAWAVLRWRRRGGWRWLAGALAAVIAATFSKEVGVVVAGGTAILVGFGVGGPERQRREWPRWGEMLVPARLALGLGGLLVGVVATVSRGVVLTAGSLLGHVAMQSSRDIRLPWHLLTEARVFWMYAWRVVLPIRLCSDHQIAWTVSASDRIAWLAAAGVVAVLAGTVVLWCRARTRPAALLLALTLLAVLHRLANVSGELMVEYRMYPAMLFLCILLAWGLERLPARSLILGLLVTAGAGLSILRARDWRSPDTLAANIVAQYPLQARARQELQEADIRAERWPAVVSEQAGIRRALDGIDAFNRSQPLRWYDPSLAALTRVDSEGNYALGLAHTGQRRAAFAHFLWLMQAMRDNHLTDRVYWSEVYYARGRFYEAIGQDDDAVLDLRDSRDLAIFPRLPQTELQQIEARRKK